MCIGYPADYLTDAAGDWTATFTIRNIGPALVGTISIVFPKLPAGVSVKTSTTAVNLASGGTTRLVVTFSNPHNVGLSDLPLVSPAEVFVGSHPKPNDEEWRWSLRCQTRGTKSGFVRDEGR